MMGAKAEQKQRMRPAISTKLQVDALKPEAKEYTVKDAKTEGLWLIVKPSGVKSWLFFYRMGGPQRKLTLGPLNLAEARKKAAEARILIAEGMDPCAGKRVYKAAQSARRRVGARNEPALIEGRSPTAAASPAVEESADLIETVVERFITEYAKPRRRAWAETERLLERHVVAKWRGRRLSEVAPHEFVVLLDEIADHAPTSANRLHTAISVMCKWASGRTKRGATPGERRVKLLNSNPFAGVGKPIEENAARKRVLSDAELALVWRASDSLGFPFAPIVKILALTGQRRGEAGGMRWDELDLDRAEWTIPGERTKNGRSHIVPLTPAVAAILKGLPRFERGNKIDYAFTTPRRRRRASEDEPADTPPSGFSKAKRRLDEKIRELQLRDDPEAKELTQWQLHDLRRTCVTGMAALRVLPHVREAVVNHVSGHKAGVAGVYDRWEYLDQKREALELWTAHVTRLIAPEKESVVHEHGEA
jgi:integrase